MDFNQSIAIVTGAGRGIGKETARLLYNYNCRVVLVSRTEQELQDAVVDISGAKNNARLWPESVDIQDETKVIQLCDKIKNKWGPVSILVNNAGWILPTPLHNHSTEVFKKHFEVNVMGTFYFVRSCFSQMIESKKGGSIVNVSSLGGIKGTEKFQGMSAYVGAKSAITGLTEAWAVDGKPHGIRVNAVAPGAVSTRMLKEAAPFLKTSTGPQDIARIIAFLCDPSPENKLTGSIIEVHSND